ncbi:PAS domain-containing sensor histidine kinase [Flavobacterium macacae]|nr:PAS domain-containing sensor histidine kinase [Flavobacterium macacae]
MKKKKQIKKLKKSKDFLEHILHAIPSLIYVYDFDKQRIIYNNKNIADITGLDQDLLNHAEIDLYKNLIHDEDRPLFDAHLEELKSGNDVAPVHYRIKNKNGDYSNLASKDLIYKRDKNGKPTQYVSVTTDVSDTKTAQKQLLSKNIELEEKNDELKYFASVASHDLKEPLRKINMFSKMILDRDAEQFSEKSKSNFNRITVSIERMEQLINDLLSYSELNTAAIYLEATDLNTVVDKVLADLKEAIEEANATFEISDLPVLEIIPSQFSQVFTNLFHNALKYAKKDEAPLIQVTAKMTKGENIAIPDAEPQQDYFQIDIKDNGIGFPSEVEDKVFDPFKRFHDREQYSGTGIGLAICKRILVRHNGFITAHSEVNQGATFSIFLPC